MTDSARSVPALEIVTGPAAGTRIEVAGEVVIGRAVDGPGRIAGDSEVSGRHARVQSLGDGRVLVEDLGSTNGVEVNGKRIPAPTLLSVGDQLLLGGTELRLVAGDASAGAPPAAPSQPSAPAARLVLNVVAGSKPGAQIFLHRSRPTVVGRGAEGADAIGGDTAVGEEHVRVTVAGDDSVVVEDLGAEHGTWIGSKQLLAPTLVRHGERFQLGGTVLELVPARVVVARRPEAAVGGVQKVPGGLWPMIGARAPVTREQVLGVLAVSLGWVLALNFVIRAIAINSLDVPSDTNAFRVPRLILATVVPILINSLGFYKSFVRPSRNSAARYLVPTLLVPVLFTIVTLAMLNHRTAAATICAILVTLSPIGINAPLMLRLRAKVARERVMQARR